MMVLWRHGLLVLLLVSGGAHAVKERELGEIFIEESQLKQPLEFIGQGSRPVDNTGRDNYSIYQNKNIEDPTEFGAGLKFNATDDFSISVEAGGAMVDDSTVDIDSGAVKFELSY
ncbi:hypothetical protein [Photobacterium lutimaris]|uniref:Porin n=1 Tax=Photobacterium lutimaris TaxID=388278 RepID=A0A2T3IYK7_9GAMM|nr:hypothetical protein [Photobacterium lutimaris]PSU33684.1 hypothetical protein C9I99_13020 [Photobacterium lutimaris]TDR74461.1 hypothetical protein DFP78_10748 [Photobacterium lutimaris]